MLIKNQTYLYVYDNWRWQIFIFIVLEYVLKS